MAGSNYLAGPLGFPGKRLITISFLIVLTTVTVLAYLSTIIHSFNFSEPSSFFAEFIAILAGYSLFRSSIDPPSSFAGAVA